MRRAPRTEVIAMRAPRLIHQHKFDLAADALLLSSGTFALTASLGLTLFWLSGGFDAGSAADQAMSDSPLAVAVSLLMLAAGLIVGPALAWRLHGHAFKPKLMLAFLGGPAVVYALALPAAGLAWLLQQVLGRFIDFEFAGAISLLVIIGVLYLAVLVHAARDAAAPAGDPPALERMRLLSLLGLLLLVFVVAGALAMEANGEMGDAIIFAMLMGFSGSATVSVAAWLDR